MDDKAEAFAECLLGDILACFSESMSLDIEFSSEQDECRFVPESFYCVVISFSKVFVDELVYDISLMPIWYFYNEMFFNRFTNSVCLKLIKDDEPDVSYLKVMSFLMLIISLSFAIRCYRSIDYIPKILDTLLKEHLKTKFYEEEKYDEISELSENLQAAKEEWYESAVEEMRSCIKNTLSEELAVTEAVTKASMYAYKPEMCEIRISDVRSSLSTKSEPEPDSEPEPESHSNSKLCPYCKANCFTFLKEFFKPKIRYKFQTNVRNH